MRTQLGLSIDDDGAEEDDLPPLEADAGGQDEGSRMEVSHSAFYLSSKVRVCGIALRCVMPRAWEVLMTVLCPFLVSMPVASPCILPSL